MILEMIYEVKYTVILIHQIRINNLKVFLTVLDKHTSLRNKVVRANDIPYMTKTLRKAIATRSKLENQFHKKRNQVSKKAYRKQKNFCSRLYKKERKKYYLHLDPKNITDNKNFWETMKPFFSDKSLSRRDITLIENEKNITYCYVE